MATDSKKSKGIAPRTGEYRFDPRESEARYRRWFPDLNTKTIEKLLMYNQELIKFSSAINLVSEETLKKADQLHFADCIMGSRLISKLVDETDRVYDLGSGNGFPGLVFGLLNPKIEMVLVDRDQRKMEFCKHVASILKLDNVTTKVQPIEKLDLASIKVGMARGLAPLEKAMLMTRKYFAKGGKLFHFKSENWSNELGGAASQLFTYWAPDVVGEYRIPDTGTDMYIVVTEKIAE